MYKTKYWIRQGKIIIPYRCNYVLRKKKSSKLNAFREFSKVIWVHTLKSVASFYSSNNQLEVVIEKISFQDIIVLRAIKYLKIRFMWGRL